MNINLNLLNYQEQLKIKKEEKKRLIWDGIRKKYLVLTPEEMVRQLLIEYFLDQKGINKNRIALERSLKVNKMIKRWDVLIYQKDMQPWLLVECKAPEVKITQAVFEQISIYNLKLRVPYLLVTNGIETHCCKMDYENETFLFIDSIPDFTESLDV